MPTKTPDRPRERTSERPCLWMSAGLLTYRLCDREYDCEHCPLDAALKGDAPRHGLGAGDRPSGTWTARFPLDRSYSPGHLWVAGDRDRTKEALDSKGTTRIGLDALAAGLLDPPRQVRLVAGDRILPGEPLFELDLVRGTIPFGAPLPGRTPVLNSVLEEHPDLVVEDPYGTGWIVRFVSDESRSSERGLVGGLEVREKARMDLAHFRRRVALELLRGSESVGPTLADGGEYLTDLRSMLGYRRYLALVRDLVH